MDAKMIPYGGGNSKIEFCDLLSHAKQIIHIKRYAGSTVLSHLFSQGGVSATLFVADRAFRVAASALLPPSHRTLVPRGRPKADDYQVLFAVISKSNKNIVESLPFFSRLNLRNVARMLSGYGFKVGLAKIQA